MARLQTVAGLAVAVVPCAILVHLVAEAMSVGRAGLSSAFFIRHIYLGVMFFAAATWFGRTVGLGCRASERRRRCALIGAQLRGGSTQASVTTLAVANLLFFAFSQLIEGVPIASGDSCLGLAAAIVGSLVSAVLVYFCGRSIIVAALVAIGIVLRNETAGLTHAFEWRAVTPRCAAAVFSLFAPNRPPPTPFLV